MKFCDVEHVCSAGLLTQFKAEHLRLGRHDPTFTTRSELLDAGLDLQAARSSTRPVKPAGIFLVHRQHIQAQRAALGLPSMTKDEQVEFLRNIARDFKQLDADQYMEHIDTSLRRHNERLDAWEDAAEGMPDCRDFGFKQNIVRDYGTDKHPYAPEQFLQQISAVVAARRDIAPGLTAYGEKLRSSQESELFVEDLGDIPDDATFSYELTCGVCHPGYCASKHSAVLSVAYVCVKNLRIHFEAYPVGSTHVLVFEFGNGEHATMYVFFPLLTPLLIIVRCCLLCFQVCVFKSCVFKSCVFKSCSVGNVTVRCRAVASRLVR